MTVRLFKTNAYISVGPPADNALVFKTNAYISSGPPEHSILLFKTNAYIGTASNPRVELHVIRAEVIESPAASDRLSLITNESVVGADSAIRLNWLTFQDIEGAYSAIRLNWMTIQAIYPVLPEAPVSETPFPGFGNSPTNPSIPQAADPFNTPLPGLTFSVHKKPTFKTNIQESAAGNEVRNALMEFPRWDFELEYEFLEDRTGAESSLKTIMGLFLQMRGSYDTFLFKDPDDYLVNQNPIGLGDGATTQFGLMRNLGGFNELVGQLDTANLLTVWIVVSQDDNIPDTPGPYTITVGGGSFYEDLGVEDYEAVPYLTPPGPGQYAASPGGVYTFNAADEGKPVVIRYRKSVPNMDYTVVMPNQLVFDVAPPELSEVWASFQFFFACRFTEDQLDFEKFMDKLWNLQQCNFRSVIQ